MYAMLNTALRAGSLLKGLRVVDICYDSAQPSCAGAFAAQGASVYRVDLAASIDVRRLITPADILSNHVAQPFLTANGIDLLGVCADQSGLICCDFSATTDAANSDLDANTRTSNLLGQFFAIGRTLATVSDRRRTGRGAYISTTDFDAYSHPLAQQLSQSHADSDEAVLYDFFTSLDGAQFLICVFNDANWQALTLSFDLPALARNPLLAKHRDRLLARPQYMPILRTHLSRFNAHEIIERCSAAQLAWALMPPTANHTQTSNIAATLAAGLPVRTPASPPQNARAR